MDERLVSRHRKRSLPKHQGVAVKVGKSQLTEKDFLLEELLWLASHAKDFLKNHKNLIVKARLQEVVERIENKYAKVSN